MSGEMYIGASINRLEENTTLLSERINALEEKLNELIKKWNWEHHEEKDCIMELEV